MKPIKDLLNEALGVEFEEVPIQEETKDEEPEDITESSRLREPMYDEPAVDYNGDPWTIEDFCQLRNRSYLNKLKRQYDSGAFGDIEADYSPNDYAVLASNEDGEYALFIWGPEGLYYDE